MRHFTAPWATQPQGEVRYGGEVRYTGGGGGGEDPYTVLYEELQQQQQQQQQQQHLPPQPYTIVHGHNPGKAGPQYAMPPGQPVYDTRYDTRPHPYQQQGHMSAAYAYEGSRPQAHQQSRPMAPHQYPPHMRGGANFPYGCGGHNGPSAMGGRGGGRVLIDAGYGSFEGGDHTGSGGGGVGLGVGIGGQLKRNVNRKTWAQLLVRFLCLFSFPLGNHRRAAFFFFCLILTPIQYHLPSEQEQEGVAPENHNLWYFMRQINLHKYTEKLYGKTLCV
jgi:hypothetical protein